MQKLKLGQKLIEDYVVTSEQVHIALDFQAGNTQYQGKLLGEILLQLGWLDRETLSRYL